MSDTSRKKLIQEYYSARANDYDRQKNRTWKSSRGFGKEVFKEILRGLKNCQKKLLLEVGVGSGRNVKPVLESINLYLVGLDLSKEMLKTAGTKLMPHKQSFDLILGDAEHLPLVDETFDAILCMSTMHYFTDQERILGNFRQLLKKNGVFIYGDLSPQESDDEEFLETLERTISKAHAIYYKASEINWLMEKNGFHVNRTRTIDYRKSYHALIEDKGIYFGVGIDELQRLTHAATAKAKRQYSLTDTEMTLSYTVINATKEKIM
jgi:ubiquinone/menaquinone biosynthesis C-methylase UbiE